MEIIIVCAIIAAVAILRWCAAQSVIDPETSPTGAPTLNNYPYGNSIFS